MLTHTETQTEYIPLSQHGHADRLLRIVIYSDDLRKVTVSHRSCPPLRVTLDILLI